MFGEFVGALDVGFDVAVGALRVGGEGGDDFVGEVRGEEEGFFTVGVVFDGGDGVGDGGVGCDVLGGGMLVEGGVWWV